MRAMVMTAFGGPEVLVPRDVPEPEPGPRDLLLEVAAASVNPVDCKTRAAPRWGDRGPPIILGFDVSGTVLRTGAEVAGFEVGDEVYASPSLIRDGANAERVCVDFRSAARKPAGVDHESAAALPLVTLTAWESLHQHGRVRPGDTVLVHAGAGGVGHIAIQLAKHCGCRVLTTAGRPESIALCESLGADLVVNHREEDVTERVLTETDGAGCDMVYDTVGGEVFEQAIALVALNGRLVSIVPGIPTGNLGALFRKNASAHFEFMGATLLHGRDPAHQGDILRAAAAMVDAGALRAEVEKVWSLEELPQAHARQESQRCVGKQVLRVQPV